MNMKCRVIGMALLTVCGLTHASMSTDNGLMDKNFCYTLAISIAQGYIAIMSDSPEPKFNQKTDAYSKYIVCLRKHQRPEVTGNPTFKAENCSLPHDASHSEKD